MAATIRYHEGDISAADAARYAGAIAIDTETLGLIPRRDRLCVAQLSPGDGTADVIRIAAGQKEAPNLVAMLADPAREKIFHYGRFDIAVLFHTFGVTTTPVFCTQDRLTPLPHLHGPAWPQGQSQGDAEVDISRRSSRPIGRLRRFACADRICRLRRCFTCMRFATS